MVLRIAAYGFLGYFLTISAGPVFLYGLIAAIVIHAGLQD